MNNGIDTIRGSGNVFRDLSLPGADHEQLRAMLVARIIGVMDDRRLTAHSASKSTGITAADFTCIRQVKIDCFNIDRLTRVLSDWSRR